MKRRIQFLEGGNRKGLFPVLRSRGATLLVLPLLLATPVGADDGPFVPLFDGKSLDGWTRPYDWGEAWIEDGVVHLRGDRKFFLVTEKTYGDFILEAEVNVPVGGNSGIQFRCHHKRNKLWGYQAEVDTSNRRWAGGLYDEGRRRWLAPLKGNEKAQAAFKNGEWNAYRIECVGDRLRISVNGTPTVDHVDSMDLEGHIALQHHGEKGKLYRFRNVRLRDLGRHRWKPLFDGKTLAGWETLPGGKWEVRDGIIVGTSEKAERRHGLLLSKERHEDLTVRLSYRAVEGNSGFYFRVDRVPGAVAVHGFQAEIAPEGGVGGLYETGGRAWVVQPPAEEVKKWHRPGEWNTMTVSAHGRRIAVTVNGHRTAELKNDPGRTAGHLGLQLHGGQDMHVEFKDIELLVKE